MEMAENGRFQGFRLGFRDLGFRLIFRDSGISGIEFHELRGIEFHGNGGKWPISGI
jgi:hypothetical protein